MMATRRPGAVGVALKWVSGRIDVDPLTGAASVDETLGGPSAADLAALEVALRLGERWGAAVLACCVGPAAAADLLRTALAAGAARAVLVRRPAGDGVPGGAATVRATADALAAVFAGCDAVVCGDYSLDGGSGAVPALLAGRLGAAQALGLTSVEPSTGERGVLAERRLDGGWRERLRVLAPMVLSVEPGVAALRRAALPAVLAARSAPIDVVAGRRFTTERTAVLPYRPRARLLPAPDPRRPAPSRVRDLLGGDDRREPPRVVVAEPEAAADAILDQLAAWGYD